MRLSLLLFLVMGHSANAIGLKCAPGQIRVSNLAAAGSSVSVTRDTQIHFSLHSETENTAWMITRGNPDSSFQFTGSDVAVNFEAPGAYTVLAVTEDPSGKCLIAPPLTALFSINDSPADLPTAFAPDLLRVAVLDSGINAHAKFLAQRHTHLLQGWDWINADGDAADDNGHGTAVSFNLTNTLTPIQILPLKILDAARRGHSRSIEAAIAYALEKEAQILVLAVEGEPQSILDAIRPHISTIESKDVLVFLSAGNRHTDWSELKTDSVLKSENLALIGATDPAGLAGYSGYGGSKVRALAPGRSLVPVHWPRDSDQLISVQGTSYAMPYFVARYLEYLSRENQSPAAATLIRFEQTLAQSPTLATAAREGRYVP